MRLNLLPIRKLVEDLTMTDTCVITRDPQGTADDTWDEATGTYVPGANDRITVYAGQCSVYPFSGVVQEDEEGAQEVAVARYWLGIPVSAEVTSKPEDLVKITAVDAIQGDPKLLNAEFSVVSQEFGTIQSSRRFVIKLLQEVP